MAGRIMPSEIINNFIISSGIPHREINIRIAEPKINDYFNKLDKERSDVIICFDIEFHTIIKWAFNEGDRGYKSWLTTRETPFNTVDRECYSASFIREFGMVIILKIDGVWNIKYGIIFNLDKQLFEEKLARYFGIYQEQIYDKRFCTTTPSYEAITMAKYIEMIGREQMFEENQDYLHTLINADPRLMANISRDDIGRGSADIDMENINRRYLNYAYAEMYNIADIEKHKINLNTWHNARKVAYHEDELVKARTLSREKTLEFINIMENHLPNCGIIYKGTGDMGVMANTITLFTKKHFDKSLFKYGHDIDDHTPGFRKEKLESLCREAISSHEFPNSAALMMREMGIGMDMSDFKLHDPLNDAVCTVVYDLYKECPKGIDYSPFAPRHVPVSVVRDSPMPYGREFVPSHNSPMPYGTEFVPSYVSDARQSPASFSFSADAQSFEPVVVKKRDSKKIIPVNPKTGMAVDMSIPGKKSAVVSRDRKKIIPVNPRTGMEIDMTVPEKKPAMVPRVKRPLAFTNPDTGEKIDVETRKDSPAPRVRTPLTLEDPKTGDKIDLEKIREHMGALKPKAVSQPLPERTRIALSPRGKSASPAVPYVAPIKILLEKEKLIEHQFGGKRYRLTQ